MIHIKYANEKVPNQFTIPIEQFVDISKPLEEITTAFSEKKFDWIKQQIQQFESAQELPNDPSRWGAYLTYKLADTLASQNVTDVKLLGKLLGGNTTLSYDELQRLYDRFKQNLPPHLQTAQFEPSWKHKLLSLWDRMDNGQKLAFALGVPLAFLGILSVIMKPNNVLGLVGASLGALGLLYSVMPTAPTYIKAYLGDEREKTKFGLTTALVDIIEARGGAASLGSQWKVLSLYPTRYRYRQGLYDTSTRTLLRTIGWASWTPIGPSMKTPQDAIKSIRSWANHPLLAKTKFAQQLRSLSDEDLWEALANAYNIALERAREQQKGQ